MTKDNELEPIMRRASDAFTKRKSVDSNLDNNVLGKTYDHLDTSAKAAQHKIIIASFICGFFFLIEIVAGYLSDSLSLYCDAYHLLADLCAFVVSWSAIWVSTLPGTRHLSFGYHRAEILGALVSILMIWFLTVKLIYDACERIIHPIDVDGRIIFMVAVIGTIGNYIMTLVLGAHTHGLRVHDCKNHEDHHCAQEDVEANSSLANPFLHSQKNDKKINLNVEAAYIHAYGDFIQNIGIVIAGACIWANPEWRILDPVCTLISGILVLGTTITIIRDSVIILMEGTPPEINVHGLSDRFLNIENVIEVHDLHVWALSIGKPSLACHLVIDAESEARRILRVATRICQEEFEILHTTIQIDYSTNKIACDTNAHLRCH